MAVAIPNKDDIVNNNIQIGVAELIAVEKQGRIHWELPGGGSTTSKPFAMTYARRLNQMIQRNVERTGRSLLWS